MINWAAVERWAFTIAATIWAARSTERAWLDWRAMVVAVRARAVWAAPPVAAFADVRRRIVSIAGRNRATVLAFARARAVGTLIAEHVAVRRLERRAWQVRAHRERRHALAVKAAEVRRRALGDAHHANGAEAAEALGHDGRRRDRRVLAEQRLLHAGARLGAEVRILARALAHRVVVDARQIEALHLVARADEVGRLDLRAELGRGGARAAAARVRIELVGTHDRERAVLHGGGARAVVAALRLRDRAVRRRETGGNAALA